MWHLNLRRNSLQVGAYANIATFRYSFVAMVLFFPKLWSKSPTVSAGNGTGADDDNMMQVESLNKGKEKGAKANTKTRKKLARTT